MGSKRGRMLCSRIATAFLSLKTDFPEGMASWHGLVSRRGRKCHRLGERGWGERPPKVQRWQNGGAPGLLPVPRAALRPSRPPSCTGGCHPAEPEGTTTASPISAAEGTRSPSLEPFGWAQISTNAGLGRIQAN